MSRLIALGHAVGAGDSGLGLAGQDSGDDEATFRYLEASGRAGACLWAHADDPGTGTSLFRCRETPPFRCLEPSTRQAGSTSGLSPAAMHVSGAPL